VTDEDPPFHAKYPTLSVDVYLVTDQGTVPRRVVKLGSQQGGLTVVKEGLKEGEWVVIDNLSNDPFSLPAEGRTVTPERVPMPGRSSP
jgi:multidrug efflux system membrane fusion protein